MAPRRALALAALACLSCRVGVAAPTLAYNMLRNPGFELRYSGAPLSDHWTGPKWVERIGDGRAQGGKWCLRFSVSTSSPRQSRVECTELLPVREGWTYRAALFGRVAAGKLSGSPVAAIEVCWLDGEGEPTGSDPFTVQLTSASRHWTLATGNATAPLNAKHASLSVTVPGVVNELLIDDLYLGPEVPCALRFTPIPVDVEQLKGDQSRAAKRDTVTLRGCVFDADGPRPGVEVVTAAGTAVADDYGLFAVSAPEGKARFAVLSPAFEPLTGHVETGEAGGVVCLPQLVRTDPYRCTFPVPAADAGYAVYANHYLEGASPEVPPREADRDRPLTCFACPGELEPVSFTLYAARDLGEVRVQVSDLWGEDGTSLPSYEVTPSLVRMSWKRKTPSSPPTELLRVPEILDPLTPFELRATQLRQVWLTVHVGESVPPGEYKGIVSVQPERGEQRELKLTVRVLPIALRTNPHKRLGIDCRVGPAFYQDLRNHGVDLLPSSFSYRLVRNAEGTIAIEPTQEDALQALKDAGFAGPIPLSLQPPTVLYEADTGEVLRKLTLLEQRDWYRRVAEQVLTAVKERDLPPVVFCPLDKPLSQDRAAEYERWARWLKAVPGARVYVATTVGPMQQPHLDGVTDVRCYDGASLDKYCLAHRLGFNQIAYELRRSGDEGWFRYDRARNTPQGSAEFTRLMNGFWLWQTPLGVSFPQTYLDFQGDPHDDLDGERSDGAVFAYPNDEGDAPVPTIQWEAFREGWDDLRYLYTLESLIWKAEKVPALQKQAKAADALLWNIRDRFPVGEQTLAQMVTRKSGRDYDASRWDVARKILELQDALPENRSDGTVTSGSTRFAVALPRGSHEVEWVESGSGAIALRGPQTGPRPRSGCRDGSPAITPPSCVSPCAG